MVKLRDRNKQQKVASLPKDMINTDLLSMDSESSQSEDEPKRGKGTWEQSLILDQFHSTPSTATLIPLLRKGKGSFSKKHLKESNSGKDSFVFEDETNKEAEEKEVESMLRSMRNRAGMSNNLYQKSAHYSVNRASSDHDGDISECERSQKKQKSAFQEETRYGMKQSETRVMTKPHVHPTVVKRKKFTNSYGNPKSTYILKYTHTFHELINSHPHDIQRWHGTSSSNQRLQDAYHVSLFHFCKQQKSRLYWVSCL